MQLPITITESRTFSDGKFLSIKGNTPTGVVEGVVWEADLHGRFTKGAQLLLEVGGERDPINIADYKGQPRLNVRKGAQIDFQNAAQPTAYAQPAQAVYTPPVAHQPTAPAQSQQRPSGGQGEAIVDRCAQLVIHAYNQLSNQGLPEELVIQASAAAPTWCSTWWFGEKTC